MIAVNGHAVLNLQQMYRLVQELHETSDFLAFEVYCTGGNAVVTISTAAAAKTLEDTLRLYRIPLAASPELDAPLPAQSVSSTLPSASSASACTGNHYGAASSARALNLACSVVVAGGARCARRGRMRRELRVGSGYA